MKNEDYMEISLNTFSLNAGVVGLIRMLELDSAVKGAGNDYFYEDSTLYISIEYFKRVIWEYLFVKCAVKLFGKDTVYQTIMDKIEQIIDLTEKLKTADGLDKQGEKNLLKRLTDNYKYVTDKLSRNSYLAAYENLKKRGISCTVSEYVQLLKAEKDVDKKRQILTLIKVRLKQEEIKELLTFKDIVYSRINMIWDNKAFLLRANAQKDVYELYKSELVMPLIESLNAKQKKSLKCCIECGNYVPTTTDLSFMVDSVEDLGRKKSVFWNLKPDAVLCPLCAFLYSLSPLGFNSYGNDLVFFNSNISVQNLKAFNEGAMSLKNVDGLSNSNGNVRLYEYFNNALQSDSEALQERIENIEVIIRSNERNSYYFNIIDKRTIEVLRSSKNYLKGLLRIIVPVRKDEVINVYQEVFYNLLEYKNQYALVDRLIRLSLDEQTQGYIPFYLRSILFIQVIKEGSGVFVSSIDVMCEEGNKIRIAYTGDSKNENALRGCIYQLLNALKLQNKEKFMDIAMRLYLSDGKPVPKEFVEMLKNDEKFTNLGYAYVMGLKGVTRKEGGQE